MIADRLKDATKKMILMSSKIAEKSISRREIAKIIMLVLPDVVFDCALSLWFSNLGQDQLWLEKTLMHCSQKLNSMNFEDVIQEMKQRQE